MIIFLLQKRNIIEVARSQLNAKWAPPQAIQTLIKDCWQEEADKRPTARSLISKLKEIVSD